MNQYNDIYNGLIAGKEKLALVGLGYVGMPIAVEFAKHINVLGFDINEAYQLSWDDKYEELCKEQNIKPERIVRFNKTMPQETKEFNIK